MNLFSRVRGQFYQMSAISKSEERFCIPVASDQVSDYMDQSNSADTIE
jgi:hypothetical protein